VDLTALTIKPAVAVSSSEKLGEKRQKFPLNRSFAPHGDLVPFNARFADGSKTPFGRATSRPLPHLDYSSNVTNTGHRRTSNNIAEHA
jgi:hypothetical protein